MGPWRIGFSIFFVWVLWPFSLLAQEPRPIIVKEMAVEGNRRVQTAVILGRIQTKVGEAFDPAKLRDDVKAVFALGFFDDVELRTQDFEGGIKVIFVVVERPLIREFRFEGVKSLRLEDVQEKASVRPGGLYNPVEIQATSQRISAYYEEQGYFGAKVIPEVERLSEGEVQVTFQIAEGQKMGIERIEIEGNHGLTASQIKGAMQTKERQFFILRGTAQRKQFDEDMDRIVALYADHGYVQARVESHEILVDETRGRVTLRVTVVEGPQFRVGRIEVKGTQVLPAEEVRRLIRLKEGEVFSRSTLRESSQAILDLYSNIGRAASEVNPVTTTEPAAPVVHISFEIREGPEVRVERINISGNTRTSETVIRREIRLAEGDLYTTQKLVRSRQRLFNLGFFDEVAVSTSPGSAQDRVVINIEVKERATGLFSIGAGFSSVDKLVGTLDVSQRNLFGLGQELSLSVRLGSISSLVNLGFTEPYFLDRPISAGFDIFNTSRIFDDFSERSIGGDLRASYPLTEFTRGFATYKFERVKVFDISSESSSALKEAEGTTDTSSITLSVVRDSRDNIFEPTRGSRHALSLAVAGLGGDSRFVKSNASTTWFYPLPWNFVIGLHAEGGAALGYGGKTVPLFERFFLGGPNTIRGLKDRSLSPTDETGARIGGTSMWYGNAELTYPLIPHFRLAAFFDTGDVYGFGKGFDVKDIRKAAGLGFRWFSPIGPIRVDWGYNLDQKDGEKPAQFYFSIGGPF